MPPYGAIIKEVIMKNKIVLADVPEDIQEEIFLLYRMGVRIEEIEYLIDSRRKKYS